MLRSRHRVIILFLFYIYFSLFQARKYWPIADGWEGICLRQCMCTRKSSLCGACMCPCICVLDFWLRVGSFFGFHPVHISGQSRSLRLIGLFSYGLGNRSCLHRILRVGAGQSSLFLENNRLILCLLGLFDCICLLILVMTFFCHPSVFQFCLWVFLVCPNPCSSFFAPIVFRNYWIWCVRSVFTQTQNK